MDAAGQQAAAPTALLVGVSRAAVGSTFAPANTFATDVTSQVDGVAAYRDLAFDEGCGCSQYGDLHEVG